MAFFVLFFSGSEGSRGVFLFIIRRCYNHLLYCQLLTVHSFLYAKYAKNQLFSNISVQKFGGFKKKR